MLNIFGFDINSKIEILGTCNLQGMQVALIII